MLANIGELEDLSQIRSFLDALTDDQLLCECFPTSARDIKKWLEESVEAADRQESTARSMAQEALGFSNGCGSCSKHCEEFFNFLHRQRQLGL